MAATDVIFNIGVAGAAAATADVSGLINKFKELKTAVYSSVSASEDYYDVQNRMSMDMSQFDQQTKGMIDTMSSLKQANILAAAGVKVTAQEFANFGKGAIETAQAVGEDATTMFERLTAAIVRGSSRGLVPFGVHLKETTDKTIAQEEAVKALSAKFAELTVETEDMNEKVYAFQNTFGTLKDQLIAPAFGNFIGWIGGVDNGFNQLSGALASFSADLSAGGQGFANWATSAEGALNIVSGVWAEITGNTEDATAAAMEYYKELDKQKQNEKVRRADMERKQEEMRNMGLIGHNEAALQEMDAYIANYEIEKELGFGQGKRRGGGKKKEKSVYGGFDTGLSGVSVTDLMQGIDTPQEEANAEWAAMQADLESQMASGFEAELAMKQWKADEEKRIEADKYAALSEYGQAQYNREKEWAQMKTADAVNAYSAGLSMAGSFFGQAASMQDKSSRKGFENSKKLQIAEASMQLPSAIMGAYTSTVRIPYIGPFIAPVFAAAAGVFGALQIKQIASQKFGGGSTSSASGGSVPSMPSGGLNNYGGGNSSGGGSTIVNNVILDGTVIHSSMIRANDGASQRGDRSFSTAA